MTLAARLSRVQKLSRVKPQATFSPESPSTVDLATTPRGHAGSEASSAQLRRSSRARLCGGVADTSSPHEARRAVLRSPCFCHGHAPPSAGDTASVLRGPETFNYDTAAIWGDLRAASVWPRAARRAPLGPGAVPAHHRTGPARDGTSSGPSSGARDRGELGGDGSDSRRRPPPAAARRDLIPCRRGTLSDTAPYS